MSPPGRAWNEASLSEHPAIWQLVAFGYSFIAAETLEAERESLKEVVLTQRLAKGLKKLNPWLSDDNVHKAVSAVTGVQATSLIEASQEVYTTLTLGKSFEQDRGEGKKSYDVRYIDFESPANNELIVTRQYKVKGAKKHIIPDVVLFVNGIPIAIVECKSPTLGEGWKGEAVDQFSRYQELEDRYRELGAPKLFETMQVLVATCGRPPSTGRSRRRIDFTPSGNSRTRGHSTSSNGNWDGRRSPRTFYSRGCFDPKRSSTSCATSSSSSATPTRARRFESFAGTSSSPL
jgi:type I restriction enzyme R subunit